jgi:hypothetical protein
MKSLETLELESKTACEAEFIEHHCGKMVEQFTHKNIAYADSFGKQYKKYGRGSALVRISDKFSRIEALMTGTENKVKDERLQDTLVDMACYCLMTLYELENE